MEEIVSKERPTKCSPSDRIDSSLSAPLTSSSFVPFTRSSSSSQAKYLHSAAPSRIWHSRIPSNSVLFLTTLASPTGLLISSTLSSPPRFRLKAQEAFVEIINFLFGVSDWFVSASSDSAMAFVSSKIALYGLIWTLSPRCCSTFRLSLLRST